MVREEHAFANDYVKSVTSTNPDSYGAAVMSKWLREIRTRIPVEAVLSASVRAPTHRGYIASFRLVGDGEVLSSEARADTAEMAIEEAGRGLCRHLPFGVAEAGISLAG